MTRGLKQNLRFLHAPGPAIPTFMQDWATMDPAHVKKRVERDLQFRLIELSGRVVQLGLLTMTNT